MILSNIILLTGLIVITVFAVRLLILPGIDRLSVLLDFGPKRRGQILGYATSLPELVVIISSALAGVFDAGFWNIASSNIINWTMFLAAVFFYRQSGDLKRKIFIDEILFGLLSVILPLLLYHYKAQASVWLATFLVLVFFAYKIFDHRANLDAKDTATAPVKKEGYAPSILILLFGLLLIVVAGKFIGSTARALIIEFKIPAWMIGWLLGFVTSIPELSGFFGIYRKYKIRGSLSGIHDTQEGLDTLVSSNMCNLGIILPIGVYIMVLS